MGIFDTNSNDTSKETEKIINDLIIEIDPEKILKDAELEIQNNIEIQRILAEQK